MENISSSFEERGDTSVDDVDDDYCDRKASARN